MKTQIFESRTFKFLKKLRVKNVMERVILDNHISDAYPYLV